MRRRFNQSRGPVQIGQGVDPFSINTTGVYIYDIYGYCHDVSSWPNGYGDEVAGVMVYSSGNPSSSVEAEKYQTRYIIGKDQQYQANSNRLTSIYAANSFSHMVEYISQSSPISGGMSNSFILGGDWRSKELNIHIDEKELSFSSYTPDKSEVYAMINMKDSINQALSRIGSQTISPKYSSILTSSADPYDACFIDWNTKEESFEQVNKTRYCTVIHVFPICLYNYRYAPKGIYKDIGKRDRMASIYLIDESTPWTEETVLRVFVNSGSKSKFIKFINRIRENVEWSNDHHDESAPVDSWNGSTSSYPNDGYNDTINYLSKWGDDNSVFKVAQNYSCYPGWCDTYSYIPAVGEWNDILLDKVNLVTLTYLNVLRPSYQDTNIIWTSNQVSNTLAAALQAVYNSSYGRLSYSLLADKYKLGSNYLIPFFMEL